MMGVVALNNIKQEDNKQYLEFTVEEDVQLLAFLLQKFSNKSRNHTKGLLVHRQTLVNEKVITKHDYLLHTGQKVRVLKVGNQLPAKKDRLKIIYEDDEIIAVNKPSGLLCIATDKMEDVTAYSLLTDYVREGNSRARIFVVHRLDRDTSGVFIVAKTERIKLALQENWEKIVAFRGYFAVVQGAPPQPAGVVKSWLRETVTRIMYSSYTPDDGLLAITNYKVLRQNEEYSLLDINIETGRKNQIRVHMKDLGCPVAGDKKYGAAKAEPLKRLYLHAYRLEFRHPITDELMCFDAQMPTCFNDLVK